MAQRCLFRLACVVFVLSYAAPLYSWTVVPATLADLTASAGRIFRGHCVAAKGETAKIAGATIPVTTYTFRVSEYLKGSGTGTVTFRQVGTAEGGPRDLGRLAGMRVYAPGAEYVLFLLPESSAGLTSPAGAGQGAFVMRGEDVQGVFSEASSLGVPRPEDRLTSSQIIAPGVQTIPYEVLRRAVLEQLGR